MAAHKVLRTAIRPHFACNHSHDRIGFGQKKPNIPGKYLGRRRIAKERHTCCGRRSMAYNVKIGFIANFYSVA